MKLKISILLIVVLLVVSTLASCGSSSKSVYDTVKGHFEIGEFHNGIAPFIVQKSDKKSSQVVKNYYGYIDAKGNVVVEPRFLTSNDFSSVPKFVRSCVKIVDTDDREYIIDKSGKTLFQTGAKGVTAIGEISYGFFWVESKIGESRYSVSYYSADNMKKVATFDGWRAILDGKSIGFNQSSLNSRGVGYLIKNPNSYSMSSSDFMKVDITEYVAEFEPYIEDNTPDLYASFDSSRSLWGYRNWSGTWVIEPKYYRAGDFTGDGLAVVDYNVVINTRGEVVLSSNSRRVEPVTSLSGKYCYKGEMSDLVLSFSQNGTISFIEKGEYTGSYTREGEYEIEGAVIEFSNAGWLIGWPISGNAEYSFAKYSDCVIVNGYVFYKE